MELDKAVEKAEKVMEAYDRRAEFKEKLKQARRNLKIARINQSATSDGYTQINVRVDTANKIKIAALNEDMSIVDFVEMLVEKL